MTRQKKYVISITAVLAAAVIIGIPVIGNRNDKSVDATTIKYEDSSSYSIQRRIDSSGILPREGGAKETGDEITTYNEDIEIDTTHSADDSSMIDSNISGSSSSNSSDSSSESSSLAKQQIPVTVKNLEIVADSVSSLKITWDAEEDRNYNIEWYTMAPYSENITFVFPENGVCYLTGLRVNEEYDITVTPLPLEDENKDDFNYLSHKKTVKTPNIPDVIQEYDYVDGWTSCFAGERASGLTAMPSSGAIYGSSVDTVTGTGIRRFPNGDYCVAMGTHYGYCNDRFLVELENGIQFTVRICDSKGAADVQDDWGYGIYHRFGGSGKCIIEMIYDDANLPSCVAFSGSWGYYNWNGLNLCSNIKNIQKLATWDNIEE